MKPIWKSTKFKGVRYREHPTRMCGRGKLQKDRYFAIRYQKNGKRVEEGIGWASELDPKDGRHWTPEKVALVLAELKEAAKGLRQGPSRLSERREIENHRKETEQAKLALQQRDRITFRQYFRNTYYPVAKTQKQRQSYLKEESHFRLWLDPEIGEKPLKGITHYRHSVD